MHPQLLPFFESRDAMGMHPESRYKSEDDPYAETIDIYPAASAYDPTTYLSNQVHREHAVHKNLQDRKRSSELPVIVN